jgi:hypothetical protein
MEEIAKLAKEKGFIPHTITTKFTNDYLLGGKNVLINETCILLWMHELQKWLRVTHKIDILINVTIAYSNYIPIIWFKGKKIKPSGRFINYENALETGLQEGLKLID